MAVMTTQIGILGGRSTRRISATSRSRGAGGRRALRHRRSSRHCRRRCGAEPSVASAADRLAMAALAFADLDATVELEKHRYTVDALEAGRVRRPDLPGRRRRAAAFPTWKRPERVLDWRGSGSPRARVTRRRPPRHAFRSSSSSRIRFPPPTSAAVWVPASRSTAWSPRPWRGTSPSTGSTVTIDVRVSRLH